MSAAPHLYHDNLRVLEELGIRTRVALDPRRDSARVDIAILCGYNSQVYLSFDREASMARPFAASDKRKLLQSLHDQILNQLAATALDE